MFKTIKNIKHTILLLSLMITAYACSDDDGTDPETIFPLTNISMEGPSDVKWNMATFNGTIDYSANKPILSSGLCYSTTGIPTIADNVVLNTPFAENFTLNLTDLTHLTTYTVRTFLEVEGNVYYGTEISFTTLELITFEIGEIGPGGGMVFYTDAIGEHGYEVALAATEFEVQWGCYNSTVDGTEASLGSGRMNSDLILSFHDGIDFYTDPAQCEEDIDMTGGVVTSTGDVAAKICEDLVVDTFDDWYLPSVEAVSHIYTNLHAEGLGDFTSNLGSSTQNDTVVTDIDAVDFTDGSVISVTKRELVAYRAIRSF